MGECISNHCNCHDGYDGIDCSEMVGLMSQMDFSVPDYGIFKRKSTEFGRDCLDECSKENCSAFVYDWTLHKTKNINCYLIANLTNDLNVHPLIGRSFYIDIDECQTQSNKETCFFEKSYCVNTFGSFHCICETGYKVEDYSCVDIDECLNVNVCSEGETCFNNIGSYDCISNRKRKKVSWSCPDGTWGTDCENLCGLCIDDMPCNKKDGSCRACQIGYTGFYCIEVVKELLDNRQSDDQYLIELKYDHCINGNEINCQSIITKREEGCHASITCNGYGICGTTNSRCICFDGYFGKDCRQLSGFRLIDYNKALDTKNSLYLTKLNLLQCSEYCKEIKNCFGFEYTPSLTNNNCAIVEKTDSIVSNRKLKLVWSYTDINECLSNPCPNYAHCLNEPGSYKCMCNKGIWSDGLKCIGSPTADQLLNVTILITYTTYSGLDPVLENEASIEYDTTVERLSNCIRNCLAKELSSFDDVKEGELSKFQFRFNNKWAGKGNISLKISLKPIRESRIEVLRTKMSNSLTKCECIRFVKSLVIGPALVESLENKRKRKKREIEQPVNSICENGGIEILNTIKKRTDCICRLGYFGTTCQFNYDMCKFNCGEHGFCSLKGECVCKDGWMGKFCQKMKVKPVDQCPENFCFNHGVCRQMNKFTDEKRKNSLLVPNMYECLCTEGWTGRHCQWAKTGCMIIPCSNGGLCMAKQFGVKMSFFCQCPNSFTGSRCQLDVLNPCDNNECVHGVCRQLGSNYDCICNAKYEGNLCNKPISMTYHMTKPQSTIDRIGFWFILAIIIMVLIPTITVIVYCAMESGIFFTNSFMNKKQKV